MDFSELIMHRDIAESHYFFCAKHNLSIKLQKEKEPFKLIDIYVKFMSINLMKQNYQVQVAFKPHFVYIWVYSAYYYTGIYTLTVWLYKGKYIQKTDMITFNLLGQKFIYTLFMGLFFTGHVLW